MIWEFWFESAMMNGCVNNAINLKYWDEEHDFSILFD